MPSIALTDENFESEVLKSTEPVLVDFWAQWCKPCLSIAPALEELSDELSGQVKIAKLNIEDSLELAASFKVQAVPMLILFKDGKPHAIQRGALTKPLLKEWLIQSLAA